MAAAGPAAARAARPVATGLRDAAVRAARACYDHPADWPSVAGADAIAERGQLYLSPDRCAVAAEGAVFLRGLGVTWTRPGPARHGGRVLCRPCLDWSERRPHVAGTVGAALCMRCFALGWLRRIEGTRALAVTPEGRREISRAFGVEMA